MQFNDTTNLTGIIQRCENQVFGGNDGAISGNIKLLKRFTTYINTAKERVITKILASDTRWQFDDNNYVDYPIGFTNLISGQQSYVLPPSQLKTLSIEVLDSNGNYKVVKPIDQRDLSNNGIAPTEFLKTNGTPQFYDIIADSIFLYPAPDSDIASGLKSRFQRGTNEYIYTDTTKETGIASNFDSLIPTIASYEYCKDSEMDSKANRLKGDILEQETDLQDFYAKRDKDDKPRLTARTKNYK